ncbi:ligase-associated DNA damage response endonuclease PdeM [Roseibacterium sp. SDUM158017]|uniref:ligase-associated DNA damage response endonuclease PdeM n=1 Tax=Roseicyclus salinarum TaxID=3036773 RepID=UPI0024158FCA|nr:ligase-associated DNA damage response endonuclease PdeM [Roseibacterium sp. SDUM158017]MDG4648234.1 ligase-associated DNA damage response endonuclease PdeM [Roseibacterium sp. SDUM158017]
MNASSLQALAFTFRGETLDALPSGALHWPAESLLVVSDLHLGKSERAARRGGPMLPPYEGIDTLTRLASDIAATGARTVVCLGDSFDDAAAADALDDATAAHLAPLMAGRRWIWIEGNHDPGPIGLGGTHLAILRHGPLSFRHIADTGAQGELSGHYHPKARLAGRGRGIVRRCFLVDRARIVMPAYGTYTGGLHCDAPELQALMLDDARAILLGQPPVAVPMPRRRQEVPPRARRADRTG